MKKSFWERLFELFSIAGSIVQHSQGFYWLYGIVGAGAIAATAYIKNYEWILWPALIVMFSGMSAFFSWVTAIRYNNRKDKRIADAFFQLENYYAPFSKIAIDIIYHAREPNPDKQKLRDELLELRSAHKNYLTEICKTAATVLGAKKGRRVPLSANIKVIHVDKRRFIQYKSFVTSEISGSERFEYDKKAAATDLYINRCYMYKRMFDVTLDNDYIIIDDIDATIREAREKGENIDEPNTISAKLAKSCLVYPIYDELLKKDGSVDDGDIKVNTAKNGNHFDGKEILLYKDMEVFGLICIDSKTRKAFDAGYDLAVVRQLTSYAFESFRVLRAVQETVG